MGKKKRKDLTTRAHLVIADKALSSPVYVVNDKDQLFEALDACDAWLRQHGWNPESGVREEVESGDVVEPEDR